MVGDQIPSSNSGTNRSPRVFNCPACGGSVTIRALGQTVTVACNFCGTLIDAVNENYQVLAAAAQNLIHESWIPLGQRGKIRGILWETIGFMRRCDETGQYTWGEYLLFNPKHGFRWLTEFDGHWNYVVMLREKPTVQQGGGFLKSRRQTAKYHGKHYGQFHRGLAKVLYVVGEFYWRVKVGDVVTVTDYIAPPEMLSSEENSEEIVWSLGEYLRADEVAAAFQIKTAMPFQKGVAPNQPSTRKPTAAKISKIWQTFVIVVCLLQGGNLIKSHHTQVYQEAYPMRGNDPKKVVVTPSFRLGYQTSNVDIALYAPVENSWLEIQAELIDEDTGIAIPFEQEVEFYSGRDSDGYWSEGSRVNHQTISSIPAGNYHLNFEPSSSGGASWSAGSQGSALQYQITVTRDVVTWSNFWWALGLLSIIPAILKWRTRKFEVSRWSTSDFSPYWEHQQGE